MLTRKSLLRSAALTFSMSSFAPLLAHADDAYTVSIESPSAKVGAPAVAKVVIKPGAGRHINKEFPTNVKLVVPAGVELPKPTISARDSGRIEEQEASIDVKYTAREAGKKTFTGTVKFAVCTATSCDPRTVPIHFTVDVHGG